MIQHVILMNAISVQFRPECPHKGSDKKGRVTALMLSQRGTTAVTLTKANPTEKAEWMVTILLTFPDIHLRERERERERETWICSRMKCPPRIEWCRRRCTCVRSLAYSSGQRQHTPRLSPSLLDALSHTSISILVCNSM